MSVLRWGPRPRPPCLSATNVLSWTVVTFCTSRHTQQLRCARQSLVWAGRHTDLGPSESLLPGDPIPPLHAAQPKVTLTCWLTTTGPASHEALCVHKCCQTHQLHPQRLLPQAWHLHRAPPWGGGHQGAALGLGVGVRDSLCRRVEVGDSRTVIEGERSFGNHNRTEPELHAHGNMVCKGGKSARAEEWGGVFSPYTDVVKPHKVELAPQMGKGTQGRRTQSTGHKMGALGPWGLVGRLRETLEFTPHPDLAPESKVGGGQAPRPWG